MSAPRDPDLWSSFYGACADPRRCALLRYRAAFATSSIASGAIRDGDLEPTFEIARVLLSDSHDLIHKASGWMLREAGKRDPRLLRRFLARHRHEMPRTMLRYAIERFDREERASWLGRANGARPVP